MSRSRFIVLTGMIFAAAATRLLPHLPNFTPLGALALFAGAQFADRRLAFGVPLAALLLSDAVLGFHAGMPAVYGCFALIVVLGLGLRTRRSVSTVAGAALTGSLLFFTVTNFAVWAAGELYPRTAAGLVACYVAAVPFFQNTLAGDAVYTAALFGGLALAQRRWPVLAEFTPAAA
ncbi:MAG: hypothetical protein NTV51_28920 [Verrucomicrobia bacterium]|nr:hypothetical protein [Verrucomicrobiota bacterium]